MKLPRPFRKVEWRKVCRCWREVRFLHVMHNDKFNRPYIELIGKHFAGEGHVFLFYGGSPETDFPIPRLDNVIVLDNRKQFYLLGLLARKAHRVIFHGFFEHLLLFYLRRLRRQLKKAAWVIWGADFYTDRQSGGEKFLRDKREVVQSLGARIVVAPGDFALAREFYGFEGPGYYGLYRLPLHKGLLDQFETAPDPKAGLLVQINNSCDASILEPLEHLRRFRDRGLRVRVILSYGDQAVRERVVQTGRDLYGDHFLAATQYLPPEQYARLVWEAGVLVMNQPRQQGLGNVYAFLYRGAKVYVRSDVTTWSFLRERGFIVFDTLKLGRESFGEFAAFDADARRHNRELAARLLDDNEIAKLWGDIFADHAPAIAVPEPVPASASPREPRAR